MTYEFRTQDCMEFLRSLPSDSCDLIFGSPPYEDARIYDGKGTLLVGQAWVDWMVEVYTECVRVCRGLTAFVVEGTRKNYQWSAVPSLLEADLHRKGFNLRRPGVFHRIGAPGSGGKGGEDFAHHHERIVRVSRPGRLPWSDCTACGHEPKHREGGVCTARKTNGRRHVQKAYARPAKTTVGNVHYFDVGGGKMGHDLAHECQAPMPLGLAELYVQSFCPPGGLVVDPFLGSGTTCHAAWLHSRDFLGCDIDPDMVALSHRRMEDVCQQTCTIEQSPASCGA